jgi:hypothetical protein
VLGGFYDANNPSPPEDWDYIFSKSYICDWFSLEAAHQNKLEGGFGLPFSSSIRRAFKSPPLGKYLDSVVYCWIITLPRDIVKIQAREISKNFPKWRGPTRLFSNQQDDEELCPIVYVGQSDNSGYERMMATTAAGARLDSVNKGKTLSRAMLSAAPAGAGEQRRNYLRKRVKVFATGHSPKPYVLDAVETVFIQLIGNVNTSLGGKLVRFKGYFPWADLLDSLPDLSDKSRRRS